MVEKAENDVEECIHRAYASLKAGEAATALGFLKNALELDYEHREVLYALKCVNWWLDKLKRLDEFRDAYERGEYILSQWKLYYDFLDRIGEAAPDRKTEGPKQKEAEKPAGEIPLPGTETGFQEEAYHSLDDFDSCQYALKRFVFTLALDNFRNIPGDTGGAADNASQQDPVLLFQIGRCCKGAGNWEEALKYFEEASRLKRDDSAILSELADINALLGNDRAAKLLFREAFFLDPQGIDLRGLDSEMILRVRDKLREMGYTDPALAEWIPVWGSIWGIFSIKRELKPVEFGRLKQSILSLENELRSKNGAGTNVKPRLLNRYFWLIDHCDHSRDNSVLDETLLKIKVIDPVVYEHYRT